MIGITAELNTPAHFQKYGQRGAAKAKLGKRRRVFCEACQTWIMAQAYTFHCRRMHPIAPDEAQKARERAVLKGTCMECGKPIAPGQKTPVCYSCETVDPRLRELDRELGHLTRRDSRTTMSLGVSESERI